MAMEYARDQGIFSTVADMIRKGGVPYKDAWDTKPPGIFYVYTISEFLFGDNMLAIRLIEVPLLFSLVAAFIILSLRYINNWQSGLVAGTIIMITIIEVGFWHTAQAETFGGICIAWGLVFSGLNSNKNRQINIKKWLTWFFSGFLFTCAGFLKPMLGFSIIAGIVISIGEQIERQVQYKSNLKKIFFILSAYVTGFIFTAGIHILPIILKGGFPYAIDIFSHSLPAYMAINSYKITILKRITRFFIVWPGTSRIIMIPGVLLAFFIPGKEKKEVEGILILSSVVCLLASDVMIQGKYFLYHYNCLIYFTALLACWGYVLLWRKIRYKRIILAFFVIIIIIYGILFPRPVIDEMGQRVISILRPDLRRSINDKLYTIYDVNIKANRTVSEWIAANTDEDDSIYIWGFETIIYDLSNRKPSSRYVFNLAQRTEWGKKTSRPELMQELEDDIPEVFVILHNDFLFHVTGNNLDSAGILVEFPQLKTFIIENYNYNFTFEDLDVYIKK